MLEQKHSLRTKQHYLFFLSPDRNHNFSSSVQVALQVRGGRGSPTTSQHPVSPHVEGSTGGVSAPCWPLRSIRERTRRGSVDRLKSQLSRWLPTGVHEKTPSVTQLSYRTPMLIFYDNLFAKLHCILILVGDGAGGSGQPGQLDNTHHYTNPSLQQPANIQTCHYSNPPL